MSLLVGVAVLVGGGVASIYMIKNRPRTDRSAEIFAADKANAALSFGSGKVDVFTPDRVNFQFDFKGGRVVVHYAAGGIDTPTELQVLLNGKSVAYADPTPGRWTTGLRLTLPRHMLKRGMNILTFDNTQTPAHDLRWGVAQVRIDEEPLPPPDENKAKELFELGKVAYDARSVAPPNLARAIEYFVEARSYLEAMDPPPPLLAAIQQAEEAARAELQNIYDSYIFTVEKAQRFNDLQGATETLRELLRYFPDPEDQRHVKAKNRLTDSAERRQALRPTAPGVRPLTARRSLHEWHAGSGRHRFSPAPDRLRVGDRSRVRAGLRAVPRRHPRGARRPRGLVPFTGHLLDVLTRRQSELLGKVKRLVAAGQAEVLGGLFYGAVPALLNELDVRGQIEMMAEYSESAVGAAPAGFWLPELAWSEELPRLLDESGLSYGFASSSQIAWPGAARAPLTTIECGGHGVAAYLLDPELSTALHERAGERLADRLATREDAGLVSVWVRAEDSCLDPKGAERAFACGWLAEWLRLLGGDRAGIESVLPGAALAQAKPALPVVLVPGLPAELRARERGPGRRPGCSSRSSRRRSMRSIGACCASATSCARRFTAWRPTASKTPGATCSPPPSAWCSRRRPPTSTGAGRTRASPDRRLRDEVVDRLAEAEAMIDTLVQGEEDWILSRRGRSRR